MWNCHKRAEEVLCVNSSSSWLKLLKEECFRAKRIKVHLSFKTKRIDSVQMGWSESENQSLKSFCCSCLSQERHRSVNYFMAWQKTSGYDILIRKLCSGVKKKITDAPKERERETEGDEWRQDRRGDNGYTRRRGTELISLSPTHTHKLKHTQATSAVSCFNPETPVDSSNSLCLLLTRFPTQWR